MKLNRKGFTLMEMLIVIAIVAVLISVAVPVPSSQLERSREAVDLANVRSAYTNFFDDVLYKTAFWNDGTLSNNALFEFDSRCPNSTYIPQIKAELDKQTNSLLLRENCT